MPARACTTSTPTKSYIDLNRAGVALMEIVSEPDMRSPEEAGLYVKKLRSILRYLGTCDGNMEEGSMRCDVNVSVRKPGEKEYRTRCEIKNVNSIRFVQQAIEYEARRQVEIFESGGTIGQETRLFDSQARRDPLHAHQGRGARLPLFPRSRPAAAGAGRRAWVADIKKTLPELPDEKKARFIRDYGLSPYDAAVLVAEKASADFYEAVAKGRDAKLAANWVTGDFFGALNRTGKTIETTPVSAGDLGALIDLIKDGTLSGTLAKEVFEQMVETGKAPAVIVEEKGLRQVTDTGAIDKAIDAVMAANADKVAEYRAARTSCSASSSAR